MEHAPHPDQDRGIKGWVLRGGRALRSLPVLGALCLIALTAQTATLPPPASRPDPGTALVERSLHNLTPGSCRLALGALLHRTGREPDALWVWTDETPRDGVASGPPLQQLRADAAPVPYAVRPAAAGAHAPGWACSYPLNSVHALSAGGTIRPNAPSYDPSQGGPSPL